MLNRKVKNSNVNNDYADGNRRSSSSSQTLLSLMGLPVCIRIYALNFLNLESLEESTVVSKQWNEEFNNEPGVKDKILLPVLELHPKAGGGSTKNFVHNLRQHLLDDNDDEANTKLQRYHRMKVKRCGKIR